MKQSNIPSAQAIVSLCEAWGIKDIVISPGSRNAPLIISFTENQFFNCYSIVDERCAAFFALGMALQQRKAAALVCTSGSALLNYYPAIAEAYYSNIPLVVISADRPPYKIDIGDGQTIRQENVFDNHIAYSANLKLDVSHSKERIERYKAELDMHSQSEIATVNKSEIGHALKLAFSQKLPVHINVPFEEPLYDTTPVERINEILSENSRNDGVKSLDIEFFKSQWNSSGRKMVLVGVNYPNEIDHELLEILANDSSVIVFTETTSNLYHPNFFPSIDSIVFPIEKSSKPQEQFRKLQPDILFTFGGMVVSKKVKAFLRLYKPKHHWHIGEQRAFDTFFTLTKHVKTSPRNFLSQLLSDNKNVKSDYLANWSAVRSSYEKKRTEYLSKIPFSDFLVFGNLIKTIPKGYQVHLANSSTVRYAQLFDMDPTLEVYCNRGTSGIEGSTSTAIGASIYNDNPTLLISGDLGFLYDSNALWNNYSRNDFRILLVNNSGGGIFRILPGREETNSFKTFFETRHDLSAKKIAELYKLEYSSAENEQALKVELKRFYEPSNKPKILEVFTPAEVNDAILLDYLDFIS